MKCNPWRWLWGLVALLPLALFTIITTRSPIEADLLDRASSALKGAGLGWAELALEGRDVTLRGKAVEDGDPSKATQTILQTYGVRVVDNEARLIEKIDNYAWQAARFGDQIRLSGHVPSDAVRKEITDLVLARFRGARIEDKMQLARGGPSRTVWLTGVAFALDQLAQLRAGEVDLAKTAVSVRGEAVSAASYRAVRTALASRLPQGIGLGKDGVRPPLVKPYVWSAHLKNGGLSLEGYMPAEPALAAMRSAGRRSLRNGRLDDRVQLADGAPVGFEAAVTAALEAMRGLEQADVEIRDRSVSFSGLAATGALAGEARAAVRRIPSPFKVNAQIQTREPPKISPYVTTASRANGSLAFTGHVPSEDARRELMALAQRGFPGLSLQDRLELGSGEAPGWRRCLETGLDALKQLGNGRAVVADRALTITGTADSDVVLRDLPAQTRAAVNGTCDVDIRLQEGPRLIETRRSGDEQKQAAAEAARQAQAQAEAVRAQQQREAEERQRQAEADANRRAEEARRSAEAEAADRRAELARRQAEDERHRAEAAQRQAQREAEEARRRAAEQARLEAEAAARRAAEAEAERAKTEARQKQVSTCQGLLSSTAREGVINFRYASDELDPKSFRTLNRLAKATQNCADLRIEIQGHTDSDGTPERNQRLSDRRARSVASYLIKAGVPEDRLATIGYGETRPVAPNDTPKHKAMNRRIEFVVR